MLWPQCWEYQSVLIQSLLEWMMMTMMMHRPAWQRHSGRQRLVRSQPAKQQFLWRKPIMRQSSSKLFTEQMHIPAKKNKKKSNHSRNFDFPLRQLNTLTLLVCGQLHGGVDVGGHLAGAEAAVLLAAVVGVVALWLQSTWANTGSVNKGGVNLSAGSVLPRCADASAGLMTGLFFCFILYNLNVIAYRASLWLHRHLTAALLCTPYRVRRSQRALKKQINRIKSYVRVYLQLWTAMSVPRRTAAEVFYHLVQTGTAAFHFSETTVPRCCLSPRRPSKTHTCPARHKHTVNTKSYL